MKKAAAKPAAAKATAVKRKTASGASDDEGEAPKAPLKGSPKAAAMKKETAKAAPMKKEAGPPMKKAKAAPKTAPTMKKAKAAPRSSKSPSQSAVQSEDEKAEYEEEDEKVDEAMVASADAGSSAEGDDNKDIASSASTDDRASSAVLSGENAVAEPVAVVTPVEPVAEENAEVLLPEEETPVVEEEKVEVDPVKLGEPVEEKVVVEPEDVEMPRVAEVKEVSDVKEGSHEAKEELPLVAPSTSDKPVRSQSHQWKLQHKKKHPKKHQKRFPLRAPPRREESLSRPEIIHSHLPKTLLQIKSPRSPRNASQKPSHQQTLLPRTTHSQQRRLAFLTVPIIRNL